MFKLLGGGCGWVTNLLQVVVQVFLPNTKGLSKLLHFQKPTVRQIPGSLPKRKESSSIFRCYVSFKEGYQIDVAKNQRTKNWTSRQQHVLVGVPNRVKNSADLPGCDSCCIMNCSVRVKSMQNASVGKSWVQHNMGWQFTDSSDLVADQALLLCMIGRDSHSPVWGSRGMVMHVKVVGDVLSVPRKMKFADIDSQQTDRMHPGWLWWCRGAREGRESPDIQTLNLKQRQPWKQSNQESKKLGITKNSDKDLQDQYKVSRPHIVKGL